jgi:hypothetical protein
VFPFDCFRTCANEDVHTAGVEDATRTGSARTQEKPATENAATDSTA